MRFKTPCNHLRKFVARINFLILKELFKNSISGVALQFNQKALKLKSFYSANAV